MKSFIADYFSCLGFKATVTRNGHLYQVTISAGGTKSFSVLEFRVVIRETGVPHCIIGDTAVSMESIREQTYYQIVNLPIDYPISTYNEDRKMTYAHDGKREYIEPPDENYNNIHGNVYSFGPLPVFFDLYDAKIAEVAAIIRATMIDIPLPVRGEIMFCLPMQSIRR